MFSSLSGVRVHGGVHGGVRGATIRSQALRDGRAIILRRALRAAGIIAPGLAGLALVCLVACDAGDAVRDATPSATPPIVVTDDAGRAVALDSPAERIISLVPAQTDILLALGARDRLIARTAFDTQPEVATLPSTGNALTPNIEWIAAQQPDLVVSWADAQSRSVVARLSELGIATYASAVETLADIEASVQRLGALTGRTQAAGSIVRAMRAERIAIEHAVAGRPRPRVFYIIGLDPTMAAGPGTFVHEALQVAGGENVFADASSRWPLVSMEEVVQRDPEVIVLGVAETNAAADSLIARLRTQPGWRELSAFRTGRVHRVDPSVFNRPAPSVMQAMRTLADLFHPERE